VVRKSVTQKRIRIKFFIVLEALLFFRFFGIKRIQNVTLDDTLFSSNIKNMW